MDCIQGIDIDIISWGIDIVEGEPTIHHQPKYKPSRAQRQERPTTMSEGFSSKVANLLGWSNSEKTKDPQGAGEEITNLENDYAAGEEITNLENENAALKASLAKKTKEVGNLKKQNTRLKARLFEAMKGESKADEMELPESNERPTKKPKCKGKNAYGDSVFACPGNCGFVTWIETQDEKYFRYKPNKEYVLVDCSPAPNKKVLVSVVSYDFNEGVVFDEDKPKKWNNRSSYKCMQTHLRHCLKAGDVDRPALFGNRGKPWRK